MDAQGRTRWAWTLLGAMLLLSCLYHQWLMPVVQGGMDADDFQRGIGTPVLRVLNGYLGTFLNLRYLGTTVGYALPLGVFAALRWKRTERWERGVFGALLVSVLVIGAFGGFNYRYALTLQPVLTVIVVVTTWRWLPTGRRGVILAVLVAISLLNTGSALVHRQRVWRASPTYSSPDTRKGSLRDRLDSGPKDLEAALADHGVAPTDTVLVNNLPIWYYLTDRHGIYYWCGSDQLFLSDGRPPLFDGRTDAQVWSYLRDTLHCRYVFSSREYDLYDARFKAFLDRHTELVWGDDRSHTLHRLKDTFGR